MLQPGPFKVTWTYGSAQEGFSVGGRPVAGAAFGPKTPGAILTWKEAPGGTVFSGSVTRPTRLVLEVDPAKSALVRQTTSYTLEASGSVSFAPGATPGAAPSVAGLYAMGGGANPPVAKFMPNGDIVSTSGARGHWELFDAEGRIYVITYEGQRLTLTYQPGRGFVDNNGQLTYAQKH